MTIDWARAPIDAEAGIAEHPGHYEAWYRRDGNGDVQILCKKAGDVDWKWLNGRKDFPSGCEFRPGVDTPSRWPGEGLPPVGTVCEFEVEAGDWRRCEVIAIKDDYAVCWIHLNKILSTGGTCLRPIRTAEQIAADERKAGIQALLDIFNSNFEGHVLDGLSAIYDANYRKQVTP